jgi:gamma-glutamylcyclotransferase (GGCT)/AIG2-like uncharacterized protein YtfP
MTPGESPVQGFVLTFTDPTLLSLLDKLEDYEPHRALEENEYYRQQIETYDFEGQTLGLAWAYLMTSEQVQRFQGVPILSGWWSGCVDMIPSRTPRC